MLRAKGFQHVLELRKSPGISQRLFQVMKSLGISNYFFSTEVVREKS